MAAPVVTGLAALIRAYFPKLTAEQVKEVILRSVVKPAHGVWVGSGEKKRLVRLEEISVTGGVVNAEKAISACLHLD